MSSKDIMNADIKNHDVTIENLIEITIGESEN